MEHVSGVRNDFRTDVAEEADTAFDFRAHQRVLTEPAPDVGFCCFHPQYRGGDLRPAGGDLIDAIQQRIGVLVRRIAEDRPSAVIILAGPVLREEGSALAAQAW